VSAIARSASCRMPCSVMKRVIFMAKRCAGDISP
jgi:hypothetical protein